MSTYRKITDLEEILTTNDSDLFIVETATGTRSTSAGNFRTGLGLGNYLLKTEAQSTYLSKAEAEDEYATQLQLATKQNNLTAGDGVRIQNDVISVVPPATRTPVVNMTETTYTLETAKYYKWGEVEELNLTLGGEMEGYLNEYIFEFTSGSTPTSINISPTVHWTTALVPQANTRYQCSIAGGIGVWIGAEL